MIQNLWRHDEVIRYRITINQSLIFRKIISQQPQEVNSKFLNHCTDRCLSKNIDKKVTLIWPLLPVQTGSQSWISLKNHISTTARGKFTIFAPLYRSLIVKKIFTKKWPNLTFTSCPNRKSKFTIKKKHISTTARGKFTIFAPLYRSLILKKVFTKRWPQFDLYFLSKPEVKVEYL